MKAYAIVPAAGAAPEDVLKTMQSLQRSDLEIIYVHRPTDEAPFGPDIHSVAWEGETVGSLIEQVRTSETADVYVWIPPGVELQPERCREILDALTRQLNTSLIFTDYLLGHREMQLHPLREDLTEREDMGLAWGMTAKALEAVGGADPSLKYTTFYDLRLKMTETGPIYHVQNPCFKMDPKEQKELDKADKLFFPGPGAFGGFSYLFLDPEEEAEIEQVFYDCLKRRGAWLEPRDNTVTPAPVKEGDPIASVVIPVHNRGSFLPKAIASVANGTLQNFEIIIVDNASSDNTREVAEQLAAEDDRIKVLHNEVNVIAKALNMGVRAARGRYIAQLDSDDEYTERTLEAMVEYLETHPKCGLAISYYELMDEEGTTLDEFGIIKHLEYNLNNILRVDGAGALRCWHKSVIEEMGGFNETDFPNYGEDYDLVLKVGEKYHVDRVHEVLYRYRRHPGNTDALRRHADKIEAKTLARTRAIKRRRALNGLAS
ncbi:glycosyltransferase [bacterium]|nr:glycosyltransferase [bacterium]